LIAPSEASSNLARYDGAHYGYRYDETSDEETQRELAAACDESTEVESALVQMYRRTRSTGFGVEVQRRIMLGTYALSAGYYDAYYRKAQQVRRLIRDDLQRAFQQVDVLAGPVAPTPAFGIGEHIEDPLTMYLGDLYTVLANLAGIPAMSLPCGMSRRGLPIGLQLQAPPFREVQLLQAGAMFQRATDWHQRRPQDP
jgi:aspartyl-tRNA(Asn)/glutamyl-tRNA(Gln) amidotransferase subunit A